MKRLWVINILFLFSCSSTYPNFSKNVSREQSAENAIMVMNGGEKIKGVLKDFNYETGDYLFISNNGDIYSNPSSVYEVYDIWGNSLLMPMHMKTLTDKKFGKSSNVFNEVWVENEGINQSNQTSIIEDDGILLLLEWGLDVLNDTQESQRQITKDFESRRRNNSQIYFAPQTSIRVVDIEGKYIKLKDGSIWEKGITGSTMGQTTLDDVYIEQYFGDTYIFYDKNGNELFRADFVGKIK